MGTIVVVATPVILVCVIMWKKYLKRNEIIPIITDLAGKVVIVTGSNSGIGKETVREMAKRGARVIMACRSLERGTAAAGEIRSVVAGADIVVKSINLALLESVKKFADEIIAEEKCVDVLINNAAVAYLPRLVTDDGLEYTFASNHLGHFLLTSLLLNMIEKSQAKRVVIVSSQLYRMGHVHFDNNNELIHADGTGMQQYSNTKLMNCLFAQELSRRVRSKGISVFALSPGIVQTNLGRHAFNKGFLSYLKPLGSYLMGFVFKTPVEGCQTVVYCASVPGIENLTGEFFTNCKLKPWTKKANDAELANKLWQYCETKVKKFM